LLEEKVDWALLAALLAERQGAPLLVLDGGGKVRLVNAAMQRLLGWLPDEIIGLSLVDRFVREDTVSHVAWMLDQARCGALRRMRCELRSRGGGRVRLDLELSAVARNDDASVVAIALEAEVLPGEALGVTPTEISCEISTEHLGLIHRVVGEAPSAPRVVGQFCYRAFFGRSSPCEQCPAAGLGPAETRQAVIEPEEGSTLQIVTARGESRSLAMVRHFSVEAATLLELSRVRVEALAREARLSARERRVLGLVLLGHGLDEIAVELAISARTVKFHLANIFEKFGVESRLDLMRRFL
jgi:PAS domain S-box-containing protein